MTMTNGDFLLAGELVGHGHRLTQRVYYEDTDFSGLVYHARYLHFLERGRSDYLRCLRCQQSDLLADRKSVVWGKIGAVRVNIGGRRIIPKHTTARVSNMCSSYYIF